jgi:hypothetical protein
MKPAAPDPGGRLPANGWHFRRERIMIISKAVVLAVLRERGLNARADFVDRELPDDIETTQHGGLLATLNLDLAELAKASK